MKMHIKIFLLQKMAYIPRNKYISETVYHAVQSIKIGRLKWAIDTACCAFNIRKEYSKLFHELISKTV